MNEGILLTDEGAIPSIRWTKDIEDDVAGALE